MLYMMIAIISDIHGNYSALKAVVEDIKNRNIKDIICLGDICGYYSQINECIELVKSLTKNVIIGNHDYYLINDQNCPRSNSANVCLSYQRSVVEPNLIKWLASKTDHIVYKGINCVHGGWDNHLDEYFNCEKIDILNIKESYAVSGHNHIPVTLSGSRIKYCNPGSVGQPRDGNYRASYAILNNSGDFEIHRVEYDYQETQRKMAEAGFNEYFYKNLEYGLPIGVKRSI